MKVISPQAYTALREALPLIAWYKPDFETYLRAAFRSHPALLVGLNFQAATKRELASQVMTRLMSDAPGYQDVTVELMLDIASMERFPYVEKIKDQADREKWLEKAEIAVAELRRHTNGFKQIRQQHEKRDAARAEHAKLIVRIKQFSDDIAQVRAEFMNLHAMTNPQERGRKFEVVLNGLFAIYDMEPKLAYRLENEQIDGAVTFDTDDYIVEAKWTKDPIGQDQLDIFDKKVQRKGKNALGIYISLNGFTRPALDQYKEGTSFLAVEGQELYYVLEDRVRLEHLLRNKKRHANETGSCMLHAREWLTS